MTTLNILPATSHHESRVQQESIPSRHQIIQSNAPSDARLGGCGFHQPQLVIIPVQAHDLSCYSFSPLLKSTQ